MNIHFPNYLAESSLAWAVLLVFYLLVLRSSGSWRARRRYLLATWAFGLLLPLVPSFGVSGPIGNVSLPVGLVQLVGQPTGVAPVADVGPDGWNWPEIVGYCWAIGVLFSLLLTAVGLARHLRPRPAGKETFDGYPVIRSKDVRTPYALCGRIYLPGGLDAELERTALLHEAAHLRGGHDRERLLLRLGAIVFWFHPLQWLYGRLLADVHEFEADAAVLRSVPARLYGRQLLRATLAPGPVPGLFSSSLKRRITMLTQTPKIPEFGYRQWSLLLFLLTGLSFACCAQTDVLPSAEPTPKVFTLGMLELIEGAPALRESSAGSFTETFYREVGYPKDELQRNEMGVVECAIYLSAVGDVTDVKTRTLTMDERHPGNILTVVGAADRGDLLIDMNNPSFSREVERTVRALGDFGPATVDGEPVASILRFEVFFFPES